MHARGEGPDVGVPQKNDRRAHRDPYGVRAMRVLVLKDLVTRHGYEVSGEDVATSIIRDAIVVPAPASPPHD